MKTILTAMAALCLFAGTAMAQNSSAKIQLSVTSAAGPAVIAVTSSATTIPAGGQANFAVAVSPSTTGAPTPTGQVELLATIPGSTAATLINTFPLINGMLTCSYALPATAPVGQYQLEFAYSGDSNYTKSPDFK